MTIYQNKDLNTDNWFFHSGTQRLAKFSDLKKEPLSREIYFSPTYSPLVHIKDTELGSCFKGWTMPSASVLLIDNGSQIHQKEISSDIDLGYYQDQLWQHINDNISKIYQKHQLVNLSYSGGIDSMVLLAMVTHLGLLHRTNIVVFKNQTQTDETCIHINPQRQNMMDEVLNRLKKLCHGVSAVNINLSAIIEGSDDFNKLRCYVTNMLVSQKPNQAWIFGFHGNQLLLHKDIFVHEILLKNPKQSSRLAEIQKSKNFYTASLEKVDLNQPLIGLQRRHFLVKPWHLLNGINNNFIYAPIGSDDYVFDLCRRLDFSKMDINVMADATMGRDFINYTEQSWMLDFLVTESLHEMDNLEQIQVPVENINLSIPDLNHDPEGLKWLFDQCQLAKSVGHIPINSLVSVKNLQWISSR